MSTSITQDMVCRQSLMKYTDNGFEFANRFSNSCFGRLSPAQIETQMVSQAA